MRRWTRLSQAITDFTGSGKALISLLALVVAWLVWGAATGWGRAWELVMFAGAPVLTLVLVIFLQHAQNRESQATLLKLNELLLTLERPSNDVVAAETKSDEELERLAVGHREAAGSGP
ncbi:MAG: putative rane protein [Acidimicrobiales bacterium]|jgi:low affinity Fe/Cu permease|nr:putative rane protein [Acidimicrobiales bacterium]